MSTLHEAAIAPKAPTLRRCRCGFLTTLGAPKTCVPCVLCGTPAMPAATWTALAADPALPAPKPTPHAFAVVMVERSDGTLLHVQQCATCLELAR